MVAQVNRSIMHPVQIVQGVSNAPRAYRSIVQLFDCINNLVITDPAMGSAGFLMAAQQYLRKNHKDLFLNAEQREHFNHEMFYGFDMDRTMLRIGAMNMLLHKLMQEYFG